MRVTGWTLMSVFKVLMTFMLFLQLFFAIGYVVAGKAFSNRYVPIEKMTVKPEADGYLFQISDFELVNRDIYLKVVGPSKELRIGREDRGGVNTKVICKGNVTFQQSIRLNGNYALAKDSVYVPLIKNFTAHQCEIEMFLYSEEFSRFVGSMSVVRAGGGEVLGLDVRRFPILLMVLESWHYLSVWYLSFSNGLPLFVGLAATLITFFYIFISKGVKDDIHSFDLYRLFSCISLRLPNSSIKPLS